MQHLEPSVFTLATQGDLVKNKGRGQVGQIALYLIGPHGDLCLGQTPRQGQVKPKFFHDVGIAPFNQQCILPRAQPGRATARQFRCLDRSPKYVKFADTSLRNPLHSLYTAQRCQRQKPAQGCQLQRSADRSGKRCRNVRCGFVQILDRPRALQAKRRLQCPMEPILAWCHRDVTQTGHIRLTRLTAMHNVPPEPRRAEIGQRPDRRYIVNRKSRV